MDQLFRKLKKIFNPDPHSATPFMHEVIERSAEDIRSYEKWLSSDRRGRMMEEIKSAYNNRDEMGNTGVSNLVVIESPSTKGFLFYYDANEYEKIDFQHCFDYLKEQVSEQGYSSYLSDVQTNVREDCVEVKERHYLKPKYNYNDSTKKSEQLYGNITIEHIMHNDHPDHIKFYCSHYNDHKFNEALQFEELMDRVLN